MIINSFRLNTEYFLELFEDVPSYKLHSQLYGLANHPIWQIGHLTISFDLLNEKLGGDRMMTEEFNSKFGTGSRPMPIGTMYPSAEKLVMVFQAARDDLIQSYNKLSMADMQRPNDVPGYKAYLPTYGDLLSHLMIGHTQYHCGQLATYRAAHGLVRIPERFDNSNVDKENGAFFECPICDKRFTSRLTFSKHLKTEHPEQNHDTKANTRTNRA